MSSEAGRLGRRALAGIAPRRVAKACVLLLLVSGAAAREATAQEFVAPRTWTVGPFTGFPDLLSASLTVPLARDVVFEPGVSILVPGGYARLGYRVPVVRTRVREVSVLGLVGVRGGVIPAPDAGAWLGPTLELGVMSYPLDDTEIVLYLTGGALFSYERIRGPDDAAVGRDWSVMPVVRLGFGKPRRLERARARP